MKPSLVWCLPTAGMAGCAVGPDYKDTAPSVPERWLAAEAMPIKAGVGTADSEALKRWWQSFGDTELDRLMEQALAGNLDIKIALARIDQARAERMGTRAELFPKVDIAAGAQRNENPFAGFAPGIKFNLFELGFDALWEIALFGRQQRRLEARCRAGESAGIPD